MSCHVRSRVVWCECRVASHVCACGSLLVSNIFTALFYTHTYTHHTTPHPAALEATANSHVQSFSISTGGYRVAPWAPHHTQTHKPPHHNAPKALNRRMTKHDSTLRYTHTRTHMQSQTHTNTPTHTHTCLYACMCVHVCR